MCLVANHDDAERAESVGGPTEIGGLGDNALERSTAWMINEIGADHDARSQDHALRVSEGEVLRQWRAALGVSSKAELSALVRTAHSIRDALRPEQVGGQRRLP